MRLAATLLLIGLSACTTRAIRTAHLETQAQPDSPDAWVALGDALGAAARPVQAQQAYAQALAIDPEHALAQERSVESTNGASRLERRAMRNPMDDEIWGDLGDQYMVLGRIEEAKQAYRRAMRLDPEDSEWRGALGGLGDLGDLGDGVEGMALFGVADDEALGDRADSMRVSGRWEEACELYAQAAALDPADTEWTQWVATCQVAPGGRSRFDGDDIEALEGRLQGDLPLLLALGRAHARAGDLEQAEIYLRGALLLSPSNAEVLRTTLAISGRDARSVLTELADEGTSAAAAGALGDHLLSLGDHEGAREAWGRAAEAEPEDTRWTARLELLELRAKAEDGAE